MSKGPTILKVSGIVMIFQAVIGFVLFALNGLSVIIVLNKMKHRTDELLSKLSSFESIIDFIMVGLIFLTSIALLVCALKSLNTYNYYDIPGGNNKYLVPNKIALVIGAVSFIMDLVVLIVSESALGTAVLSLLSSSGWILALLNLILVKKDRAERAKEEPQKAWRF